MEKHNIKIENNGDGRLSVTISGLADEADVMYSFITSLTHYAKEVGLHKAPSLKKAFIKSVTEHLEEELTDA